MKNTTTNETPASLMFALSQLLEAHGTTAVLEALRDAADACADHDEHAAEKHFRAGSAQLVAAAKSFATAERLGTIALEQGAIVLADCGDEESVSS